MLVTKYFSDLKAIDGAGETASSGMLEGYASTWDIDQCGDRIQSGAWAKTLGEVVPKGRVKLLDNHNSYGSVTTVLGVIEEAKEDAVGLYIRSRFASTQQAQNARTLIKEGMISDFSVGFRIMADKFDPGTQIRTITEAKLIEVSVVAFPANLSANISRIKSANHTHYFGIDSESAWNEGEALERFEKWVSPLSKHEWGPKEWKSYSLGFLAFNGRDGQGLLVDVKNNTPVYHMSAASNALMLVKAGKFSDVPPQELEHALNGLLKRAGKEAPAPAPAESGISEDAIKGFEAAIRELKMVSIMNDLRK